MCAFDARTHRTFSILFFSDSPIHFLIFPFFACVRLFACSGNGSPSNNLMVPFGCCSVCDFQLLSELPICRHWRPRRVEAVVARDSCNVIHSSIWHRPRAYKVLLNIIGNGPPFTNRDQTRTLTHVRCTIERKSFGPTECVETPANGERKINLLHFNENKKSSFGKRWHGHRAFRETNR